MNPRTWFLIAGSLALAASLDAQSLQVRVEGEQLRVAAPRLRFVSGAPLERLRNGAPVAFVIQLALAAERGGTPLARDVERFVLSFDLWEEKISALRLGRPRRSAPRLTTTEAETWCLAEMALALSGIDSTRPLWARVEVRAEERREAVAETETGFSITRLIDAFSRRPSVQQPHWSAEAGPLRLAELRKARGNKK